VIKLVLFCIFLGISNQVFSLPLNLNSLSVDQVYKFDESNSSSFGHLISFQIGNIVFKPDSVTIHPISKKKHTIVGAITSLNWTKKQVEPLQLRFVISKENARMLKPLLPNKIKNSDVQFNFQLFTHDKESKKYYINFKSLTMPQKGILNRIGYKMPALQNVSHPVSGKLQRAGDSYQIDHEVGSNLDTVSVTIIPTMDVNYFVYAEEPKSPERLRWHMPDPTEQKPKNEEKN
jgi:hypothetical protein